jgi:nucleoside phosphorylase
MDRSLPRLTHDDYTVAFICPMGVELAPAEAMLDEMHQSLPASRYNNSYTLGCMGAHNVVIAVMPEIGNNYAATVATQLLNDFKLIRFGLLVGIGGGIPGDGENDIRLGDVVVSKPTATFGGVIQFDRGKVHSNRKFERTGTLKKPPAVLMASVQRLESQHRRVGNQISKYLSEMLQKFPKMEEEQYVYQGMEHDQLFEASYIHETGKTCQQCDRTKVVERAPRRNTTPRIHYGSIGSANEVIKDSKTRDELRGDLGIICVEMEAAGLMDEFSCLVIRGICDYADSHKNKSWQPYAAATAAAYAKELLSIIPAQDIVNATKVADGLQTLNGTPGLPELNSPNAFGRSRFDSSLPTCH